MSNCRGKMLFCSITASYILILIDIGSMGSDSIDPRIGIVAKTASGSFDSRFHATASRHPNALMPLLTVENLGAPGKAWCFLQGVSPCRVRSSQPARTECCVIGKERHTVERPARSVHRESYRPQGERHSPEAWYSKTLKHNMNQKYYECKQKSSNNCFSIFFIFLCIS